MKQLDFISEYYIVVAVWALTDCNMVTRRQPRSTCTQLFTCEYSKKTVLPVCYCDTKCYHFGDCCLDVNENLTDISAHAIVSLTEKYECYQATTMSKALWIKSDCSSSSHTNVGESLAFPVVDEDGTVYKNREIAMCSNARNISYLDIIVSLSSCDLSVNDSVNMTYEDLVKSLFSADCDMVIAPAYGGRRCMKWSSQNQLNDSKCQIYHSPLWHDNILYKNKNCISSVNNNKFECFFDSKNTWMPLETPSLPIMTIQAKDISNVSLVEPNEEKCFRYNADKVCRRITVTNNVHKVKIQLYSTQGFHYSSYFLSAMFVLRHHFHDNSSLVLMPPITVTAFDIDNNCSIILIELSVTYFKRSLRVPSTEYTDFQSLVQKLTSVSLSINGWISVRIDQQKSYFYTTTNVCQSNVNDSRKRFHGTVSMSPVEISKGMKNFELHECRPFDIIFSLRRDEVVNRKFGYVKFDDVITNTEMIQWKCNNEAAWKSEQESLRRTQIWMITTFCGLILLFLGLAMLPCFINRKNPEENEENETEII